MLRFCISIIEVGKVQKFSHISEAVSHPKWGVSNCHHVEVASWQSFTNKKGWWSEASLGFFREGNARAVKGYQAPPPHAASSVTIPPLVIRSSPTQKSPADANV